MFMITVSVDKISIIHYQKITKVLSNEIHIELSSCKIIISGNELYISYLNADEIILEGIIKKVEFNYYDERI